MTSRRWFWFFVVLTPIAAVLTGDPSVLGQVVARGVVLGALVLLMRRAGGDAGIDFEDPRAGRGRLVAVLLVVLGGVWLWDLGVDALALSLWAVLLLDLLGAALIGGSGYWVLRR